MPQQAKVTFVGISRIAWNAPLHEDDFINDEELTELIDLGAIGEIAGWAFDPQGNLLQKGSNTWVASLPLEQPAQKSREARAIKVPTPDTELTRLSSYPATQTLPSPGCYLPAAP